MIVAGHLCDLLGRVVLLRNFSEHVLTTLLPTMPASNQANAIVECERLRYTEIIRLREESCRTHAEQGRVVSKRFNLLTRQL